MHALAAFEAAARLQTFSKAAEEICVTQSAISHRIRQLEEHLGVKLFVRVHKQVVLTPPGQAFLTEVRESMERLSQASARVSDLPVKRLRITASHALAFSVLIPHLNEFFERSGYVDLEIDTSSRVLDLDDDRFDLALRFGTGNWPGYATELLVEEQVIALASPKYAAKFGRKRSIADLTKAALIHSKPFSWSFWFKSLGYPLPTSTTKGLVFVDVAAAVDAAAHGLGVVLANRGASAPARRNGNLVPFIDQTVESHRHYFGVYRRDSEQIATIRDFLDWIKPLVVSTFG